MLIEKLPPFYFTFETWRAGSMTEFGVQHRYYSIIENKNIILKYAIGYCPGEKLWIRPKNDEIAIMFFYNDNHFWCHFRKNEFEEIFK